MNNSLDKKAIKNKMDRLMVEIAKLKIDISMSDSEKHIETYKSNIKYLTKKFNRLENLLK